MRLGDFSFAEVKALYQQHAEETGQIFKEGVLDRVWHYTQGQPWLVNALGYEVCFRLKEGKERERPITTEMVEEAKENLIIRRETHLDQLVDKLREERVRGVLEPILAGHQEPEKIPTDDLYYVRDLGLIRVDGHMRIANAIYQEIIPRELTYTTQMTITHDPLWYISPDHRLDMTKLLSAFQEFFREHSEHWIERFQYKEAGPQLLLQAFLQRIVNAGGRIEREYGLGRMRTDLLVIWGKGAGRKAQGGGHGVQRVVIELKILYKSMEQTIMQGLQQTYKYMDRCGTDDGHLVIFDRREGISWEEKIFRRKETYQGKEIVVWGM